MQNLEDAVTSFVEKYALSPKDVEDGKELGYDPATQPWQFKLARHLRDTDTTIGHLDWGPEAINITVEERAKLVYECVTSSDHEVIDTSLL